MDVIRSEDKYLHLLAVYNRRIGMPSIFVASITASILLWLSAYMGYGVNDANYGFVVKALLIIVFLNTLLMLLNFLSMDYLFDRVLKGYYRKGLPYASLLGVEAIYDASKKETRYALILCASSITSLAMYLLGSISLEIIFLYISMGSALMTFGFSIIRREHVLDPDEMLRLYEPDNFPAILTTHLFIETFVDPFNRLKFREYEEELSHYIKGGLSVGDVLSKLTILLYQNISGALRIEDLRLEFSELLKSKEHLPKIEMQETFSFTRLKVILGKARKLVPEFTSLMDRLFVSLLDDLPEVRDSEVYIDSEVSPEKKRGQIGRCFILLYNNLPDRSQTFTASYSSASVAPTTSEVTITLPPRDFNIPEAESLPVYSKSSDNVENLQSEDVVGLMGRMMDNSRFVWFSFEVKENGLKPIVLSVKNKETGMTTYGRTFLLEASYDLPDLALRVLGILSVFIGVFLPIARLFKLPV